MKLATDCRELVLWPAVLVGLGFSSYETSRGIRIDLSVQILGN